MLWQQGSDHRTSSLCPTCNGNDQDMPCAYPSEGKPGCLREIRFNDHLATEQDISMKLFDRVMDWLEVRPLWQIVVGSMLAFAFLVMLVGCDDRPMVCLGYARQRLAIIESCVRTPRCSLSTEDLREMDYLRSNNVIYIRCGDDR